MTLQQCRYLIEISRHHSISKAAEELFVTQPSISKAIHELEADLNIRVLERSRRGVTFTGEGLELLSYAKMMVEQEQTIRYHFNRSAKASVLRLSVSSQHFGFAAEAVIRLMHFLGDRKYEFSFWEEKTEEVIEHVANGVSALGVLALSSLNRESLERRFAERSLVFTKIAALPVHVFLRARHPLAGSACVRPEQLRGYPCLTYRRDDTSLEMTEGCLPFPHDGQTVFVQDRGTMDDLLAHTDGYNLGTGCIAGRLMGSEIISIPLALPWQIYIGYIKNSGYVLPDEALRFIDYLEEAAEGAAPGHSGAAGTEV